MIGTLTPLFTYDATWIVVFSARGSYESGRWVRHATAQQIAKVDNRRYKREYRVPLNAVAIASASREQR